MKALVLCVHLSHLQKTWICFACLGFLLYQDSAFLIPKAKGFFLVQLQMSVIKNDNNI